MRSAATKRTMYRLEGSFWMMRANWAWTPLLIIPGWLAASDPPGAVGLIAIMATAALSRAGANVINEIVDSEKDRVTAPELPIPSGVVSLGQAVLTAAAIAAAMMVTSAIASVTLLAYIGCLAALFAGAVLTVAYSLVKPYWLLALSAAAGVYVCLPLAGWLAAGAGSLMPIALVLLFQFVYGIAGNVQAALRDIDLDGDVGNQSVAVHLGARRSLRLGAAAEVLAHLTIVAIGFSVGRPALAISLVAVSLGFVLSAYAAALEDFALTTSRSERAVASRRLILSRQGGPIALVAIFSVPIALATAIGGTLLLKLLTPAYSRRILDGRLADDLSRAEESLARLDHPDVSRLPLSGRGR
jgi:4-hydroxybenzoate polyprenyltransferase